MREIGKRLSQDGFIGDDHHTIVSGIEMLENVTNPPFDLMPYYRSLINFLAYHNPRREFAREWKIVQNKAGLKNPPSPAHNPIELGLHHSHHRDYSLSLARPLARLRAMTERPPGVAMRALKP